jgi:hypothetical protein
VVAKSPSGAPLDRIVETPWWIAVLDQSTPKGHNEPDVVGTVARAVEALDGSTSGDPRATIEALSRRIEVFERSAYRPCVTVVLLDVRARLVVRVGDGHVVVGPQTFPGLSPIDEVLGPVRALVNHMHGHEGDPGRALIEPILVEAGRRCRNDAISPYGFGALDGTHVPDRFIEVFRVPPGEVDICLMSDGYPEPARTLDDAEALIATVLGDPKHRSRRRDTKGMDDGQLWFDDRAFIRVVLGARDGS